MHDPVHQADPADLRADVGRRAAALFAAIDDHDEAAFIALIDSLADELPDGDADALFHRACARDSWGRPDLAVPLYRRALELGGPTGENRRRAVIQLASSLRNLGDPAAGLALLEAEGARGSDHLDDALAATTALCLASLGREREGLSLVLVALAEHLPRYNRSMANYGRALVEDATTA
ncbi:tetratricopeptide repeat protein [Kitasatospora paracochleata]|uniref:Tetratricopeptide (TPR) repeat protein n=1 Tax=Kitasatospora paracochleata TaxID=58354 RepID=A0ABT1J2N3_9ACTN|nr:tetratricopeptide repeat protein [Kitasatospora paracochleata]MCP2311690.1 tetratricopeptide (TPR) repeat protein [Kitasatospora paracochleata]